MDEKKTYLVNIESNLDKYIKDLVDAKKALEDTKFAVEELKKGQFKSREEIESTNAAYRQAQKEYAQAKKMVDLQTAANKSETGSRKQLGEILKIQEQQFGKLGNAYIINAKGVRELNPLYVEQRKRIAETKQAIIDYDQSLNDGRSNIGRYGASVTAAFKSIGESVVGNLAPVALLITALEKLKEAFAGTEYGEKVMNRMKTSFKVFMNEIVSGHIFKAFFGGTVAEAQKVADEFDKLRIEERKEMLRNAELETEIKLLRIDATKVNITATEKFNLLTKAQQNEDQVIINKREHLTKYIEELRKLIKLAPTQTAFLDELNAKEIELEELKGEKSLRIASKTAAEEMKIINDFFSDWEKETLIDIKKRAEIYDKNNKLIMDIALLENPNISQFVTLRKKYEDDVNAVDTTDQQKILLTQKFNLEWAALVEKRNATDLAAEIETGRLKAKNNADVLQLLLDQEHIALQESTEYKNMTNAQQLLAEQKYTDATNALSQLRLQQKMNEVSTYANLAGAMSNILGKQSEAGKAFAVAEAIMNTYAGATLALYDKTIPSTYLRIAMAATVILNGLNDVKEILAVNTGGGTNKISSAVPTTITSSPALQHITAPSSGSSIFTQPLTQDQLNVGTNQKPLTADDIAKAVAKLPAPIVTIEDINVKAANKRKVEVRANI